MATSPPVTREARTALAAPSTHETPSDPLALFRALAIAIPIGLLTWIAIFRAAWWLWRG